MKLTLEFDPGEFDPKMLEQITKPKKERKKRTTKTERLSTYVAPEAEWRKDAWTIMAEYEAKTSLWDQLFG